MTPVRWLNLIDFFVLTLALYGVLNWARQARAMRLVFWIVGLYAASLAARRVDLIITSWVLTAAAIGLIVMLLIVFQPELRRAFQFLDRILRISPQSAGALEPGLQAVAEAAFAMAHNRMGALIVMVRKDPVSDLIEDGVPVGAEISRPLLEAIFQKTSPVHDGAVIVESERIARVNAVLPLSHRPDIPAQFGTRHRAAMGIAERSDALVIVSSEERGEVTLMRGPTWRAIPSTLALMEQLQHLESEAGRRWYDRLGHLLIGNLPLKLAAAGLGILISALSLFSTGSTIRTVPASIEFQHVPRGLNVVYYSPNQVQVSLRGRAWLMDAGAIDSLVARFDLSNARAGTWPMKPAESSFSLPPGIKLDGVEPPTVMVTIRRQ